MAKKSDGEKKSKKTKSDVTVKVTTKRSLTNLCAFWGLALAALLFLVSAFVSFLSRWVTIPGALSTTMGVLDMISKIALLVAIALPAYSFVRGKKRSWKITYWVAFAVYALGVVFGVIALAW